MRFVSSITTFVCNKISDFMSLYYMREDLFYFSFAFFESYGVTLR